MSKRNIVIIIFLSLFLISNVFAWSDNLNVGLKHYYKLDETSGTNVFDELFNDNGTASNEAVFTTNITGILNSGFDDTINPLYYYTIPPQDFSHQWSISFWIKVTGTSGDRDKVLKERTSGSTNLWLDFYIEPNKNYALVGSLKDNSEKSLGVNYNVNTDYAKYTSLNDNQFHHIVINIDTSNKNMSMYVDGVLESWDYNSQFGEVTWSPSPSYFFIGAQPNTNWQGDNSAYGFLGVLDEIAIYNRTLSESEVNQLYNNKNALPYGLGDSTPPNITNINWITTGGFSGNLVYLQTLKNITVKVNDSSNISNVNITLYNPSNVKIIDNKLMSEYTAGKYNYSKNILLNVVGNWSINITAVDEYGNQENSSTIFEVSINEQSIKDGWYGYSKEKILNLSEILNLATYDYDIFELEDNITNLENSWNEMKTSINNSRNVNIKVGLNYKLNFNYDNTVEKNAYIHNITTYFPDLLNTPYTDTIEYISFELVNQSFYSNNILNNLLNDIALNTSNSINNKYIIFSKNYNNSGLSGSYITYTDLIYFSPNSKQDFINMQYYYFKNSNSLNRIYYNINNDDLKNYIKNYHFQIFNNLRSVLNNSINNKYAINLKNGDVLVFNNQSFSQNITINISELINNLGKDVWDFSHKYIIEDNSDLNFTVEVNSYNTTILYFEDLDHIEMNNDNSGILYTGGTSSTKNFNYTDNIRDSNWGLSGAYDMQIELFDPHYIKNNFIVYYGWLNVSRIESPNGWDDYSVVIIADKNNNELDKLHYNITEFYGYISVADYNSTQSWLNSKESEVDEWLNLNNSLNIFVDGLDYGIGGSNFSNRMRDLIDYIQIDKNRKAILNTYTYYQDFATWGNGGVMKESCVNRWNGNSAGNPDNYTRENWSLELEKSTWYKNHNIRVFCQSFNYRNRSDSSQTIENYTDLQNIYFASKVLGYNYFYLSQPDFNYAHTIYIYDVGEDLDRNYHQLLSDPNTYYRTYEKGIVYYNTTSKQGWINDGRIINNAQLCFYLYDEHPNSYEFNFDVNHRNPFGSNGEYKISDNDMTLYGWKWVCKNISEDTYAGRYLVEAWTDSHTVTPGQGFDIGSSIYDSTGRHSWWDTSPTDYWNVYQTNQNWMVNLKINESKRTSIDTTSQITQTEQLDTINKVLYINISSTKHFPIEVISNTFSLYKKDFEGLYVKNLTGSWIELNITNTSTCVTSNPVFNVSIVNGVTYKACYTQTSNQTIFKVTAGELSTQQFSVNYTSNVEYCYNCSDCNNKIQGANSGDTVILINNINNYNGRCIDIENKNNITFDCNNSLIDGVSTSSGEGIYFYNNNNSKIYNCNLNNFKYGIFMKNSNYSDVENVTITSAQTGLYVGYSNHNYFYNLTSNLNSLRGMYFTQSYNNIFNTSVFKENSNEDVYLYSSTDYYCNNMLYNVTGSGNRKIGYYNYSVNLNNKIFSHLTLCNAGGSNITNVIIDGSDSIDNNQFIITKSDNLYINNLTSNNNKIGISIYNSNYVVVKNSTFINNKYYGVYVSNDNYGLYDNIISTNNGATGIRLNSGLKNNITNSIFSYNNNEGMYAYGVSHTNIINTDMNHNKYGALVSSNYNNFENSNFLYNSYKGIWFWSGQHNSLINNTFNYNNKGIEFYQNSNYNTMNNSYIINNTYGLYLHSAEYHPLGNLIYNNLFNNTNNLLIDDNLTQINYFNTTLKENMSIVNTSHIGGNLWSNPNATGFSDICDDNIAPFGICDNYYNFSNNNIALIDWLPLSVTTGTGTPLMNVINPTGEDEHAEFTLFKVEINKVGNCVLNLGGDNITMDTKNNLIFYKYLSLVSDTIYNTTFYCNGSAVNSTNQSNVIFYYRKFLEHQPPSGGGSSSSDEGEASNETFFSNNITNEEVFAFESISANTTLKDLKILIKPKPIIFEKRFDVIVYPIDEDKNNLEVDIINISINITDLCNNYNTDRLIGGGYKKGYIIHQQNISEFEINIFAKKENITLSKNLKLKISQENTSTKLQGVLFNSYYFIQKHWFEMIFILIISMFVILLSVLIKFINSNNEK